MQYSMWSKSIHYFVPMATYNETFVAMRDISKNKPVHTCSAQSHLTMLVMSFDKRKFHKTFEEKMLIRNKLATCLKIFVNLGIFPKLFSKVS